MSDLEVIFKLPEELIERAQKVGMALDQQNERVVAVIDAEVRKREAAAKLNEIEQGLQSLPPELKPTPEEIDAEIRAYRAEKTISESTASTESRRLLDYCKRKLDLANMRLSEEYGYASLPLCVIDAVYSIGVNYASTQNAVKRFCTYVNIPLIKIESSDTTDEFSIAELLNLYQSHSAEQIASSVYQNRQRTSTHNGILKAEAVRQVAEVLRRFDVNVMADIQKILGQPDFEQAFKQVPGQGSGVSLRYFYMLTGSVEYIKPDRMIIRFISAALERDVKVDECHDLLVQACLELAVEFPKLTPRTLDNFIWQYQRTKPTNL